MQDPYLPLNYLTYDFVRSHFLIKHIKKGVIMYLVNNNNELLQETIEANIKICNQIYTQIDRTPQKKSDADFMLVKTFNTLVELNQMALDILYPERNKNKDLPKVKHLIFKQIHSDKEDMVEIEEIEADRLKQEFNWEK